MAVIILLNKYDYLLYQVHHHLQPSFHRMSTLLYILVGQQVQSAVVRTFALHVKLALSGLVEMHLL